MPFSEINKPSKGGYELDMDKTVELKRRISQRIGDRSQDIVKFLQSLIRIPSVTDQEKDYQLQNFEAPAKGLFSVRR
jgi:hypothetical protein